MAKLDPSCPEHRRIATLHAGQVRLLLGPGSDSLAGTLRRRHADDLQRHAAECARCALFATLPTHCPTCGALLARQGDRLVCASPTHALKGLFRGAARAPRAFPLPAALLARAPAATTASATRTSTATAAAARAAPAAPKPRPAAAPRPAPASPPPRRPSAAPAAPRATRPAAGSKVATPSRPPPSQPPRRAAPKKTPLPPRRRSRRDPLAEALRVVGVGPDASPEEVRAAYREKAHFYHPDKSMHLSPDQRKVAEDAMKALNGAYQTLKRLGRA